MKKKHFLSSFFFILHNWSVSKCFYLSNSISFSHQYLPFFSAHISLFHLLIPISNYYNSFIFSLSYSGISWVSSQGQWFFILMSSDRLTNHESSRMLDKIFDLIFTIGTQNENILLGIWNNYVIYDGLKHGNIYSPNLIKG